MDRAAKQIAEKVEERTDGAIKIEVTAGGGLPSGADGIEQCIRGSNYISLYDISAMADWVPDYVALCGPFLVENREEFAQLCESDLVAEMNAKAEEQGVKVLAIVWALFLKSSPLFFCSAFLSLNSPVPAPF